MAETVNVVVTLKMKPECVEQARPLVLKFIEDTRKQKGTLRYDFFQDVSDPGTFIIIEEFADQASFEGHRDTEHYKSIAPNFAKWLTQPPEARILKPQNIAKK